MDCSNCGCTLNIKDNKLLRLNQISAGTQTPGNWRDLQDSEAIMDLEGKKIFITGVGRGDDFHSLTFKKWPQSSNLLKISQKFNFLKSSIFSAENCFSLCWSQNIIKKSTRQL